MWLNPASFVERGLCLGEDGAKGLLVGPDEEAFLFEVDVAVVVVVGLLIFVLLQRLSDVLTRVSDNDQGT